jgi:hypothetical protein
MVKRSQVVISTIGAAVILAASTIGVARTLFERRIAGEVNDLFAASSTPSGDVIAESDLAGLPEPVQRWLRYAGVVGTIRPTTVRLKQEGEIRMGDRGWFPFTAEEYYTTDPPGFVWSTTITMSRVVTVVGRDKYVNGRGDIEMRLLGLVPVAQDRGAEMDRGALLRYLNEIMWFPAAAISPYITWEPIDATSARAAMTYGGISAPATFSFNGDGRLTNMVADRFDRDDGQVNRWSTPIKSYGEFDGIRIPVEGEASYAREGGEYVYIRARITEVEYDRPDRY